MPEPAYVAAVVELFARPARPLIGSLSTRGGGQSDGVVVEWSADVEAGILQNVGFRVWGCPHIIALCNGFADRLDGATVEAAAAAQADWLAGLAKELDIPTEKAGKILIIKDTLFGLLVAARSAAAAGTGAGTTQ